MAWENYIQLAHKESSNSAIDDQVGDARRKTLLRGRHDLGRRTKHEIYSISPRRHSIRKDTPKTHGVDGNGPPETKSCSDDQTDSVLSASYQEEAKKLLSMKRSKDRLRGHCLLYDIPNGLDDTAARFIMAVTLRYDFENPGESSVSGSCHSARSEKEHLQKCMMYADPIIQHLHENGIIYIRQLLPAGSMACTLSSIGGVTNEYVLLSGLLLSVLHQICGGRHLRRRYLTSTCRQFLDTQNELKRKIVGDSNPNDQKKFSMASLLGEWAAAGSDDFNDDDNPGGLWMQKARCSAKKNQNETRRQEMSNIIVAQDKDKDKTRTNRSWVTAYTAKILSESESKTPAICPYRHGKLLDGHVLTKK